MGVVALHVAGHSQQGSLQILALIVVIAAAFVIFREYRGYLHRRFNRRSWK